MMTNFRIINNNTNICEKDKKGSGPNFEILFFSKTISDSTT